MKRLVPPAAAAALLALLPSASLAQNAVHSDGGWWDWALPEVVELQYFPTGARIPLPRPETRDRTPERERTTTRPDIRDRFPERDRRDGPAAGSAQQRQGHGPPFCRNGSGHPVHGMQWCRDKGWTSGVRLPVWDRANWGDVVLRGPRDPRRAANADARTLRNALGGAVYRRMEQHGRQLGANSSLSGRWITDASGARILQVRAGDLPIAEFTDLSGDGRADAVLLNAGR